ncbi:MAG: CRISPR-associated protein Csx15 [Aliarcobacter sp.]
MGLIVNFGHPITDQQLQQIARLTGREVAEVRDAPCQFDHARPFAEQARAMIESVGLTPEEWQTLPILVNLPALSIIAALVLAELHGRMGYFPTVLRLRPVEGAVPPRFEVVEILNLQQVRDQARRTR